MKYKIRDIVFVPFPYIEQPTNSSKNRPALVIGVCNFSKTYILAKITSTVRDNENHSFVIKESDVEISMRCRCEVSTDIIFTVDESIILRRISEMKKDSFDRVKGMILSNFEE